MHCVSCQAQLAPGSASCYFCGASQPAAAGGGYPGSGGVGAQWLTQAPAQEGWRIWASFFLGGLYAPIASNYLLEREKWNASGGTGGQPPSPPSNRGLAVLGLFVGLPALSILVFGFATTAGDVNWYGPDSSSWGVRSAHRFAFFNIPVAWFYLLSLVLARRVDREFTVLLHQVTGGSRAAAREYAPGRIARAFAHVLSVIPLLLLGACVTLMITRTWVAEMDAMAAFYVLAVAIATWATSWLHVTPLRRFRRAVMAGMP